MTERKAVRYIATARGYVDGRIVDEGEAFVTTAPKGSWMEPVDKAEYEAAKATEAERDDPNYDAMTLPALQAVAAQLKVNSDGRSEERRVGKECVSTCKARWWPYHSQKKTRKQR